MLLEGVSSVHRRYVGQCKVLQLGEVRESRPLKNKKTRFKQSRQGQSGALLVKLPHLHLAIVKLPSVNDAC